MTRRYCPKCETLLQVYQALAPDPHVRGRCPKCHWEGSPDQFLSEYKPPMNPNETPWAPYVSIDIETTGLDPDWCQVLEVGAVIDDWKTAVDKLPTFRRILKWPKIIGQPYALALNAGLLKLLAQPPTEMKHCFCEPEELGTQLADWLHDHAIDTKRVNAAGKNFASFDLQFLRRLPRFSEKVVFRHRTYDPAMFFWHPDSDPGLPDTKTCLGRAELQDTVAHTAVEDAQSVIHLIRRGIKKMRTSCVAVTTN